MKNMKQLAIEIYGTNELNRLIKIEVENIIKQLPQYIGKKIFLTQGNHPKTFVLDFLKPQVNKNEQIGVKAGGLSNYSFGRGDVDNLTIIALQLRMDMSVKEKPTDQHCIAHYFNNNWIKLGVCDGDKLIEVFSLDKIIKINKLDEVINEQEEKNKIAEFMRIYEQAEKELYAIRRTMKVGYSDYLPSRI